MRPLGRALLGARGAVTRRDLTVTSCRTRAGAGAGAGAGAAMPNSPLRGPPALKWCSVNPPQMTGLALLPWITPTARSAPVVLDGGGIDPIADKLPHVGTALPRAPSGPCVLFILRLTGGSKGSAARVGAMTRKGDRRAHQKPTVHQLHMKANPLITA